MVVWRPERPGGGIGDIDQSSVGSLQTRRSGGNGVVAFDRAAGWRGIPVKADEVYQVQLVGWAPGHGWVVVECTEELLGEGVGSSRAGTRLRADDGAEWSPA